MADIESKFILFTTNRSGSVWVLSTLNSIKNVTAQGELFLPRKRSANRKWDSDFAHPRFIETKSNWHYIRPFSVFSYLDNFFQIPGSVGFKLLYQQIRLYPEILIYSIRHKIHFLHLVRKNHLDVLVSFAIKEKIGQAHILSGQTPPEIESMRVALDPKNLIQRMEQLERNQNIARSLLMWSGLPQMEISYEDLIEDQALFQSIWRFLRIDPNGSTPVSSVVKIRRGKNQEVIINYDEVEKVLIKSKFSNFL